MKKLAIGVTILVVLVFGTNVVAAGKDDNPLADWGYIKDKVDAIWGVLTDSDYGLEAIDDEIESIENNMPQSTWSSGHATINPGADTWDFGPYDEVRHFSLTATGDNIISLDLFVRVVDAWVELPGLGTNQDTLIYEFDAKEWRIEAFNHGGVDHTYSFNYTATY